MVFFQFLQNFVPSVCPKKSCMRTKLVLGWLAQPGELAAGASSIARIRLATLTGCVFVGVFVHDHMLQLYPDKRLKKKLHGIGDVWITNEENSLLLSTVTISSPV